MKPAPPARLVAVRDALTANPLRDERSAALLGAALGILFVVCFATGLLSHLVQDPGSWFHWPSRPAGLYRVTQGLHVIAGVACIPLLFVKLWIVYPKLFEWPPVRSMTHALERALLLPLIGAALVLVATGLGNINVYRPWGFSFRAGHLAAAWVLVGALLVHATAKWATTTRHLRGRRRATQEHAGQAVDPALLRDRRWLLGSAFGAAAGAALLMAGQTVRPLRRLALVAPRRPDAGPQGFPVNRTAASVGLTSVDLGTWRLTVRGADAATDPVTLDYAAMRSLPQHEATLPIACVEGWSTSQRWRGVRLRDVLALAGLEAADRVTVVSMQRSRRQQRATLQRAHVQDPDTLLALEVNGEALAPDHGFPVRLIAPNLPGVHQIKWVDQLEVP